MIDFPYLSDIIQPNDAKILMLVADGLGGLPQPTTRRSELESARVPNLDRLAQASAAGSSIPVSLGVTPGSGPGHLALFGYDPLKYLIGRGALEALGIGMELQAGDVAARGNFATVDGEGNLVDRRAGRIETELAAPLAQRLDTIAVDGIDLTVQHVKDYRFVLRLRGSNLSADLTETDPQRTGVPALAVASRGKAAAATAKVANAFVADAQELLKGEERANAVLLRGWAGAPNLPPFGEAYGLRAAAIAAYPMYRGLASIVGMDVLPTGDDFNSQIATLRDAWDDYTFFFLHYKHTDSAGEDGDFDRKRLAAEALDAYIPALLAMGPDVLMVAGDHSTPSSMASHSWHPVPFILRSQWTLGDGVDRFNERELRKGSLGIFEAKHIMMLALAHAGKLQKFGA